MADDQNFSFESFGASFKGFLDQMATQSPAEEPVFRRYLTGHFQTDPTTFPIVTEEFGVSEHQNLQMAINTFLAEPGVTHQLFGIVGDQQSAYFGINLAQLLSSRPGGLMGGGGSGVGPVQYVNLRVADGEVLSCVQSGLFLITTPTQRLAVMLRGPNEMGINRKVVLEAMADTQEKAAQFLREIRTMMRRRNIYRGRIISLSLDNWHNLQVNFHSLPAIANHQIILPKGLLERIERQTIGFARHSEKLLAAGRHLKRGMLLHGLPGTGKTLTAMYLASQMKDRTVIVLTGRGLGMIEHSCAMARLLQPAIVILEDVDLVAEERTHNDSCNALLFELLNQMDGLANDADVLFLLTTNRPDMLEPALAARPGRVDQAIEIPLPDAECRQRLFELYGQGLQLQVTQLDHFIDRTEGASGAFIRELLRKAALFAADDEGEQIVVKDHHLDEALHELVIDGGTLTQSLLGVQNKPDSSEPF